MSQDHNIRMEYFYKTTDCYIYHYVIPKCALNLYEPTCWKECIDVPGNFRCDENGNEICEGS